MAMNNGNLNINYSGASNSAAGDILQFMGFQGDEAKNTDFKRNEIAQDNQLLRDLYFQSQANAFNAEEAQKNRDWQTQMSNTEVQRKVNDLKKAGLNPVLALMNGGASTPSGSTASSGGSRSSSGYHGSNNNSNVLLGLAQIMAGIYTSASTNATKMAIANLKGSQDLEAMKYGSKLRMSEFDYKYKKMSAKDDKYLKEFKKRWKN